MFSPAGSERICKNMLYSIIKIGYHKNRVVSTKSFENTIFSAGRKKKRGKLLQKERGLDGASPLDKIHKLGDNGGWFPRLPYQVCAAVCIPHSWRAFFALYHPNSCLTGDVRFHMLFGFHPASGRESVPLVCPHCRPGSPAHNTST